MLKSSEIGIEPSIEMDLDLVSSYGSLIKLPSELRILVWRSLLESEMTVYSAFKLMMPQQHLMVATCPPIPDIDAAILRTSRAIYNETFPILYKNNRCAFSAAEQISIFAFGQLCWLPGIQPVSDGDGFSFENYGRLLMLRSVTLTMNALELGRLSRTEHILHDQEAMWSRWAGFFNSSWEQQSLDFPLLEELCLDFCNCGLDASDESKLRVEPILRKLRPSGGLGRLWILGVEHEQNLIDFKHGFLKKGGKFKASDNQRRIITQGMVSLNDLHTASKGVRDILQRERAST